MRARRIWRKKKEDFEQVEALRREMGISRIFAGLLVNRGLVTAREAEKFLHSKIDDMESPLEIPGLAKGRQRIAEALENGEHIMVYGDYDVDGITATALLTGILKQLGGHVEYYIPSRMEEGYGLNKQAIQQIAEQGFKLIVTVDCGISSLEEADYAAQLGIDLVITDHHQLPPRLPDAIAVINPKLSENEAPWRELSGVGVAFKTAQAVAASFGKEDLVYEYLDLAALGTIADIVPLLGENRILVREGLKKISGSTRPGMQALLTVSGNAGKDVSPEMVGFTLAPRLNACGRLSRADLGVELLTTDNALLASEIAGSLDRENQARQALEAEILNEALSMLPTEADLPKDKAIVLAKNVWHPGVIGIVASRLTEKYCRPTILIALENGVGKGSGRSIPGFNLHAALQHADKYLINFGGHEMAAGLTLTEENITAFRKDFLTWADQCLEEHNLIPVLDYDDEVAWQDLTFDLVGEIQSLAPFGNCNPSPRLALRGKQLLTCKEVGAKGTHLKVRVQGDGSILDGIAFQLGVLKEVAAGWDRCDLVFVPEINRYNGRSSLQLVIKDLKSAQEPDDPFLPLPFLDRLYMEGEIWLDDDYYRDIMNREEFYTKVVGVTFENRQELITGLPDGEGVQLQREPQNRHDPYAVAVCFDGQRLGFLNARLARNLAPAMDKGAQYEAYVSQVTGRDKGNLGLNICVRRVNADREINGGEKVRTDLSHLPKPELLERIRRVVLGKNPYHQKQEEALECLLTGCNSLIIFATGRGKSAVFQSMAALKALADNEVTVIIYPLRSLVNDQYHRLTEKMDKLGVVVEAVNGSKSAEEKKEFFKKLLLGRVDIVLTTPEFLDCHLDKFGRLGAKIGFFVVDEAHHLARSKRRGYRALANKRLQLGAPLTLAATATADDEAAQKIAGALTIKKIIIEDHERSNLSLVDRRNEKDKTAYLANLLARGEKTVIYVNSRKQSYQLASELRLYCPAARDEIGFYHGGLNSEDRHTLENLFKNGALRVMVTTSAFGEGIDIPDIRHVVLYHLCFSAAEFNQLAGRAGRDNEEAWVHIIFGAHDRKLNELILESAAPTRDVLVKFYLTLREKAKTENPLSVTNYELQQAMQECGFKNFREQTASASLAILEEMGLLLREVEGNKRYIHMTPPPPGKLELTDSVRYLEGLEEWEEFQDFADYVLTQDAGNVLSAINKPISPSRFLATGEI